MPNEMIEVSRTLFASITHQMPHLWSRPVNSDGPSRIAPMQWVNPETNRLMAQAVYQGTFLNTPRRRQYFVWKELMPVMDPLPTPDYHYQEQPNG